MITKIIHEEKIQKAKKYVEKGESFVIVTHVTPDGDAIGSSLGLYHFLTTYGKDNVTVVVPMNSLCSTDGCREQKIL